MKPITYQSSYDGQVAPSPQLPDGVDSAHWLLDPGNAVLCYLAPGSGVPRSPDWYSTWCIPRNYTVSRNLELGDGDAIVMVSNMLSDRNRVGTIFHCSNDGTVTVSDLNVAGDVVKFRGARSVCGLLNIRCATLNTTNFTLSGQMTTVGVQSLPKEISYMTLPQYSAINEAAAVNTPLYEGQSILQKPRFHDFEFKSSVAAYGNVTRGQPLEILTTNGTEDEVVFQQPLSYVNGCVIEVDWRCLRTTTAAASFTITTTACALGWNSNSQTLYVTETTQPSGNQVVNVTVQATEANQVVIGHTQITLATPPEGCTWSKLILTDIPNPLMCNIKVWPTSSVFSTDADLRFVTMITGNTGTKTVAINGVVGFELIPQADMLQQITLSPPVGVTALPLEIFIGLLNNPNTGFRLVWRGEDYFKWVKTYLFGRSEQAIIDEAQSGVGHASLLDTVKNAWKTGVRWLKKVGVDPGKWLHRGTNWLQENGYASNLDNGVGFCSTVPINTCTPTVIKTVIQDLDDFDPEVVDNVHTYIPTTQTPMDNVNQLLRYGNTSLGHCSMRSLNVVRDLDDLDDMEDPVIEAEQVIEPTTQHFPTLPEIIQAAQIQAGYSVQANTTIPALRKYNRFAPFIIMQQVAHQDIPKMALMEFTTKPRDGYKTMLVSDIYPDIRLPMWLDYLRVDIRFGNQLLQDQQARNIFLLFCMQPPLNGIMGVQASARFEVYMYIHTDANVAVLRGTSWFGALNALFYGKDITILYEIAANGNMSKRDGGYVAPTIGIETVGNLAAKGAKYLSICTKKPPEDEALACLWYDAMQVVRGTGVVATLNDPDSLTELMRAVGARPRNNEIASPLDPIPDRQVKILVLDAFWFIGLQFMTKDFRLYLADLGATHTRLRLIDKGTRVGVVADEAGAYYDEPTLEEFKRWLTKLRNTSNDEDGETAAIALLRLTRRPEIFARIRWPHIKVKNGVTKDDAYQPMLVNAANQLNKDKAYQDTTRDVTYITPEGDVATKTVTQTIRVKQAPLQQAKVGRRTVNPSDSLRSGAGGGFG